MFLIHTEDKTRFVGIASVIGGLSLLLITINFFPERVGIAKSMEPSSRFVLLFAPAFRMHLPWLNLWWGLALIFKACEITLLITRSYRDMEWQYALCCAGLGLGVLGMFVLWQLITCGPVVKSGRPFLSAIIDAALQLALLVAVAKTGRRFRQLLGNVPLMPA